MQDEFDYTKGGVEKAIKTFAKANNMTVEQYKAWLQEQVEEEDE